MQCSGANCAVGMFCSEVFIYSVNAVGVPAVTKMDRSVFLINAQLDSLTH